MADQTATVQHEHYQQGILRRTSSRVQHSTSGALERLHQSTDVGSYHDLIAIDLNRFFPLLPDRRQVPADHVRASGVVIVAPFANDVVQVPPPEQDELPKTFALYALDESFRSSIEVGRRHLEHLRPYNSYRPNTGIPLLAAVSCYQVRAIAQEANSR